MFQTKGNLTMAAAKVVLYDRLNNQPVYQSTTIRGYLCQAFSRLSTKALYVLATNPGR